MIEAEFKRLCEIQLKRELTREERLRLEELVESRPEWKQELELERLLDRSLNSLPDVPVAGNFTSLLLQRLERETKQPVSRKKITLNGLLNIRFFKPAFVCLLLLGIGVLFWSRHQSQTQIRMRETVASLTETPAVLDVEVLENFEMVVLVGELSEPDTELLALLD